MYRILLRVLGLLGFLGLLVADGSAATRTILSLPAYTREPTGQERFWIETPGYQGCDGLPDCSFTLDQIKNYVGGGGSFPFNLGAGVGAALQIDVNTLGGFPTWPIPATGLTGTLQAAQAPAFTGDVTSTAGSLSTTIASGAVTASKMASGAAVGNLGFTPLNPATMIDDLSVQTIRPLVLVGTGQSNILDFGEGYTVGTVDQSGGGIWVWDNVQNQFVRAQYGTYPFTYKPPGLSTYSPNILLEEARYVRAQGIILPGRPIYLFLVGQSGVSIANWAGEKIDGNGLLTEPTGITQLKTALTLAMAANPNMTKVDYLLMSQGQRDSTTTTADSAFVGGAFPAWGFGNNATGLQPGTYSSAATVAAVQAAGGFNTLNGYLAAAQQTVTNWRSLPGMSNTPIGWLELNTYWQAAEQQRNDAIRRLAGLVPYLAIIPSSGMTGSLLTNNQEHFDGPSVVAMAQRSITSGFLPLYRQQRGMTPYGIGGVSNSGGLNLKITNNIDNNGAGSSQSPSGTYYSVSTDQLRNNLYIYTANSALYLPLAAIVGDVDLDIECWTGTCTVASPQTIIGYPSSATVSSYVLPSGTVNANVYTIPTGARIRLNSGRTQWAFLQDAYKRGLPRGSLYGGSANIGTNGSTAFFSSSLVNGNIATLSYSVGGGGAQTVSASFDVAFLNLSGALVTGNTLAVSGTINGTAFTPTSTLYATSSAATLTAAASALQTSLQAVVGGATVTAITNGLQVNLPTSTTLTLTGTVTGGASQVTANYDGSGTANVTSDLTVAALATSLQTALGSTYTVDAIPTVNALTVTGPSQVAFNVGASSVVGGASQAAVAALLNTYALSSRHVGAVWSAVSNTTYVLPPSNSNNPGDIGLLANGGGGTAGQISIDAWADTFYDGRSAGGLIGSNGANPFITVPVNGSFYAGPDASSRWVEKGGSYINTPSALQQGGLLATSPARIVLSGALVSNNVLSISGTVTPNAGSPTTITTVNQPYVISSSTSLGLAAKALATSIQTVIPSAVVTPVYGQNIIQIDFPSGSAMALSGVVTGGASQAVVTTDTGKYSVSPTQMGFDWYTPVAGATIILPHPNGYTHQRIGLNGQGATVSSTVNTVSGLIINRAGKPVNADAVRSYSQKTYEAGEASRWIITGGIFPAFPDVSTVDPTTADIAPGACIDWTNSTNGTTRRFCNSGSTITGYPNVVNFSMLAGALSPAPTVSSGNSGGTDGVCTLTVSGGVFSTPATFTGTVSGGAIGALTIAQQGSYTALPGYTSVPVTGCGFSSLTVNINWGPINQTYVPSVGTTWIEVRGVGAGSGGGGGALQASGAAVSGGAGGSAGAVCSGEWQMTALGMGNQTVSVGLGGTPGVAATSNSSAGGASGAGGNTTFGGTLLVAYGGGSSAGGQLAAASASGGSASCLLVGQPATGSTAGASGNGGTAGSSGAGGIGSVTVGTGSSGGGGASSGAANNGGFSLYAPSGGGSGGGITTGNVSANGGNSGQAGLASTAAAGGSGAGASGNAPAANRDTLRNFGSGGAGGASSTTSAFTGGSGALGGGGGGGGSSQNGGVAGSGGKGGDGALQIIEHAL